MDVKWIWRSNNHLPQRIEDIGEAEKFSEHLNSLNSGCDQYEVGLFKGKFISRCGDSFELEEDE